MLNAVEPKHNPLDEHLSQAAFAGRGFLRDLVQTAFHAVDDRVDMREGDFFLARKVKIDAALSDSNLSREVVDRHLLIAPRRKHAVGCIKNGALNVTNAI